MRDGALVIGYGNPLRGDDGLGPETAKHLAASSLDESVEILALHQLAPELSELISKVGLVVFIDSSHIGQPGSWACEVIEPDARSLPALAHDLTPKSLLTYTQAIFKASPRALLVSVVGESFDCRQELTPTVAHVLPAVEQFVRQQVTLFTQSRNTLAAARATT
jgi:hydrogenase maturation protease